MGHRTRAAIAVVSGMVAIAATLPVTATPAAARTSTATTATETTDAYCAATVTVINSWATGYVVSLTIRNISTVPVRWQLLTIRLQDPVLAAQFWNARVTLSGSVLTAVPAPDTGVLAPGESVMVGTVVFSGGPATVLPTALVTCSPV